jgi:hypothetical protein
MMGECTVHSLPSSARRIARASVMFVATIVLASTATSLIAPTAALADDSDGISGTPASEVGADGRSRFSYEAAPGQSTSDNYQVSNTGSTAQTMHVFATDAYNTEDGSYGLLDTEAEPTDAGSWVTFSGGAKSVEVPLEPGASQLVTFSVAVPADASPGDHAAGIAISVSSPQGQILVDRRVATRLYVRVPGDLQPGLTISSISSSYHSAINPLDGTTSLTFNVANTGNIALGANMVIGVNTYLGIAASDIVRKELSEMLPRSTRSITISVPGVPQLGYLNPHVSLAPTVSEDAMNPGVLTTVDRDTVTFAIPWWLVVVVALAGAVWLVARVRRGIDDKRAAVWIAHTEAEARRKAEDETSARQSELVSAQPVNGREK